MEGGGNELEALNLERGRQQQREGEGGGRDAARENKFNLVPL